MSLDKESTSTTPLPNDFESVKRLRTRLDESRKSTLESLRLALLDSEVITEKLTAMKNLGSLDSRPGHIIPAVNAGIFNSFYKYTFYMFYHLIMRNFD